VGTLLFNCLEWRIMSMSGTHQTPLLTEYEQVLTDIYGKWEADYDKVAAAAAVESLARLAGRYEIPFAIVVALPIRMVQRLQGFPPTDPSVILDLAVRFHRTS
jgi:hypothetical protein